MAVLDVFARWDSARRLSRSGDVLGLPRTHAQRMLTGRLLWRALANKYKFRLDTGSHMRRMRIRQPGDKAAVLVASRA